MEAGIIPENSLFYEKEARIKRELIAPYNPEQNGVVERKNRAIEESVKIKLHDQDIPKFLWGEATKTILYIQNRSSHRSLGNITPEEVFTGKKPNIDHLRIFGCHVYIHIPNDKRKKVDPASKKGIFVGYNDSSQAYRIYMKEGHQIQVIGDLIFDESIAFKKSKDLPSDFDEDLPMFEEQVNKEEEVPHHEEEGPREPISLPKKKKET